MQQLYYFLSLLKVMYFKFSASENHKYQCFTPLHIEGTATSGLQGFDSVHTKVR